MALDLSKKMTMDEWRFLHSPQMYYAVYGSNDPDAEGAALAAFRSAPQDSEASEDYIVNVNSNVEVKG